MSLFGTLTLGINANFTNLSCDNQIQLSSNDSSNLPAYTWKNNSNTGMYHLCNDVVGLATAGVTRLAVSSNVNVYGDLNFTGNLLKNGTSFDVDKVNFAVSNLAASNVRASVVDSSNVPSYSWVGDTDTGMYHLCNDVIGFTTSGVNRMAVSSNVNVYGDLNFTGSLYKNGALFNSVDTSNFVASNITASNITTSNLTLNGATFNVSFVATNISTLNTSNLVASQTITASNITASNIVASNLTACNISIATIDSSNLPSYTWLGDTNTGMYHVANDVVGLTAGGVNMLTITASNAGINTLTPTFSFDVNGTIRCTSNYYCGTVGTSNWPCYSWAHDSNTGMFNLCNDVMGFAAGGKYVMTITSSGGSNGRIGVGTSNPFYPLHVAVSTCNDVEDVSIYAERDISAFSDARYKTNIEVIQNAWSNLDLLHGYTYNWITGGKRCAGVLAQEVQQVLPEVVNTDPDGKLSVAYGNLISFVLQALKEMKQEIIVLKQDVETLKTRS